MGVFESFFDKIEEKNRRKLKNGKVLKKRFEIFEVFWKKQKIIPTSNYENKTGNIEISFKKANV